MKKTFFALAILLATLSVEAQPLANHLYFSGGLGFSSISSSETVGTVTADDPNQTIFEFSPAIGYTFTDHWLAGLRLGVGSNSISGGSSSNTFGAELFARYNIPITDQFYFYPEGQLGFNTSAQRNSNGDKTAETDAFFIGIAPGFAFFPSTHWSMELTVGFLGYTYSKTAYPLTPVQPHEVNSNRFGFNVSGTSVNLGIAYYLAL